jgi:hypothetical protein
MVRPLKRIRRSSVSPTWRSKIASNQISDQSGPPKISSERNPAHATVVTPPEAPLHKPSVEGKSRSTTPATPSISDDEKVGYGNPPKKTQFRKGQSGNPKGRPKGLLNNRTLWEKHLSTRIPVVENGKKALKSKQELIVIGTINKAVKGDHKATQEVLKQSGKYLPDVAAIPGSSDGSEPKQLSPIEKLILKQFHLKEFFPETRNESAGDGNSSQNDNDDRPHGRGERK